MKWWMWNVNSHYFFIRNGFLPIETLPYKTVNNNQDSPSSGWNRTLIPCGTDKGEQAVQQDDAFRVCRWKTGNSDYFFVFGSFLYGCWSLRQYLLADCHEPTMFHLKLFQIPIQSVFSWLLILLFSRVSVLFVPLLNKLLAMALLLKTNSILIMNAPAQKVFRVRLDGALINLN